MIDTSDTLARKTILVVEDDPLLANLFQRALTDNDFNILVAYTGDSAIEMIKQTGVDLIFLDIMLPGKNGFQVLKELKQTPETKTIPVVLLTNLGEIEHMEHGLNLGAADYIIKANIDMHRIKDIANKHLVHLTARYHHRKSL